MALSIDIANAHPRNEDGYCGSCSFQDGFSFGEHIAKVTIYQVRKELGRLLENAEAGREAIDIVEWRGEIK